MRTYLATLHKRSPAHKKRFALMTSASFTLLIFGIWSISHFGTEATPASANKAIDEASVFGSFQRGFESSVGALKSGVNDLKQGLEVVNSEAESQNYQNYYAQ